MAKKIIIDTFFQLYADTGIRTYTNQLVYAAQLNKNNDYQYIDFPSLQFIDRLQWFRNNPNRMKRWVFQILYLVWKQIILPISIRFIGADVIFSPDYVSPLWKMRCLKISVVHSPFFWQHPENYSASWLKYQKCLINLGFRGRSIALTTSEYVQETMKKFLRKDLEVLYQQAKALNLDPNYSNDQLASQIQERPFILHVGYFDKRKNLDTLVKAYNLYKQRTGSETILILAGGYGIGKNNDAYTSIEELIKKYQLGKNVLLPGYVNDENLAWLYSNAALYVFPSYDEGFGIPVLEAFSFDTPVLVSEHGSLREIGGEAVISFKTFSESDLSQKIETIIGDQQLKVEMTKKGRERLKFFTGQKMVERLNQITNKYVS